MSSTEDAEDTDLDAEEGASKRLDRNVYVASVVSFVQDTASEILYPILPFFVTTVLGAPPAVLGLIEGLADGTAAAMKAASGRLSDFRRRRPMIGAGYSISAFGKFLLALAGAWPMVLVSRFTDRVGKGLRGPPRDALIADVTTAENRGRAFGFHRAADTAGAVIGPLLGLGLFELFHQRYRPLFWVAVVPAALSALLVLLIRERPHEHPKVKEPWVVKELGRKYWGLMGFIGLFALVNFPDTLLLLRAKDLGMSFAGVVAVYVLYNLSYAALSYPAGVVSDKRRRRTVFATGLIIFACAYLGFGLTSTRNWAWVLFPLYGGYTALTDGVSRAWVAEIVVPQHRGSALGLHAAISGAGLLVAGVWAGLLWHGTGRFPFLVSGAVTAVVGVALVVFGGSLDRRPAEVSADG